MINNQLLKWQITAIQTNINAQSINNKKEKEKEKEKETKTTQPNSTPAVPSHIQVKI